MGLPHKRKIFDWSGRTAGAPGSKATTSASRKKKEMVEGEAERKQTCTLVSQSYCSVTSRGCPPGGVSFRWVWLSPVYEGGYLVIYQKPENEDLRQRLGALLPWELEGDLSEGTGELLSRWRVGFGEGILARRGGQRMWVEAPGAGNLGWLWGWWWWSMSAWEDYRIIRISAYFVPGPGLSFYSYLII